jgi:hypothetical protein
MKTWTFWWRRWCGPTVSSRRPRAKPAISARRTDVERLAVEYFSSGRQHPGIVVAVRRSPQEIVRRLLLLLNQTTADEMRNQLRYL